MRLSSIQDIPARVQKCAVAHQLGTPRILYESGKTTALSLILGPAAFLVGCVILGIYQSLYETVFSWWPVWQAELISFLGMAWLIVGAWIMLTPMLFPHTRIYLCPKGLIYIKHRMHVIRWNQIDQLWKQVQINKKTQIAYTYTLRRQDGRRFALKSELPHLERLGGFMEREIIRQRLTRVIGEYSSGIPQDFAALLVSTEGITLKRQGKTLPWREVEGIGVDKATVSLYRKGDDWEWATLNIASVPNVSILKGLIEHVLSETLLSKLPQILAYNAGFSVFFGKVSINKAGVSINNGEEQFPWSDIASFGVGESEIIIRRKSRPNEWFTLPIWMIPDAPMLKNLVDYILRQQEGK